MIADVFAIRDVSAPPLERHTAAYLAAKRKRLTEKSERGYSAVLREFVDPRRMRNWITWRVDSAVSR